MLSLFALLAVLLGLVSSPVVVVPVAINQNTYGQRLMVLSSQSWAEENGGVVVDTSGCAYSLKDLTLVTACFTVGAGMTDGGEIIWMGGMREDHQLLNERDLELVIRTYERKTNKNNAPLASMAIGLAVMGVSAKRFTLTHKCIECDRKVGTVQEITEVRFEQMSDSIYARIDRNGVDDNSPVVGETNITMYNSLCSACMELEEDY